MTKSISKSYRKQLDFEVKNHHKFKQQILYIKLSLNYRKSELPPKPKIGFYLLILGKHRGGF